MGLSANQHTSAVVGAVTGYANAAYPASLQGINPTHPPALEQEDKPWPKKFLNLKLLVYIEHKKAPVKSRGQLNVFTTE